MDDLDRLFHRLVQVLRNSYPEYLTRPFEVAELYQTVLPYRHHRRELGIETNQDYEIALMELLSGARGYVIGDEVMQESLRQELDSPNPDPTAFRAFGQSHVSVAAEAIRRLEQSAASRDQGASRERASPVRRAPAAASTVSGSSRRASSESVAQPAATVAPRQLADAPPPRSAASAATAPAPTPKPGMTSSQRYVTASALGGSCRYCGSTLPDGRRLVFCPHCGQNLTIQHCPACSTELEVGWKFCTTCGRSVASA